MVLGRKQQEEIVEAIIDERIPYNQALVIGASCIIEAAGHIVLVVEIESRVSGVTIDPVVVILISREQAERLINAGVRICAVRQEIPRDRTGLIRELKGAFIAGNQVINIFEIETPGEMFERFLLVSTPLVPVINQQCRY